MMMYQVYSMRSKLLLVGLVSVIFIIFLYIANPSSYYFLNDDFVHIPLAAKKNFIHGSLVRPISDLSLWIDFKMYGKNPYGYHLTNLFIHLANSLLFYFLAIKLFSLSENNKYNDIKAIASALLFLVYAFHSESVFWIIGRGGSLATFFFLITFILYLKSWEGGWVFYLGSLLFFGISLLVYEVVWIYPLVVLFFILYKGFRKKYWHFLGILGVFGIFLFWRIQLLNAAPGNYECGRIYEFNITRLFYNYNTLLARCFIPPMKSSLGFVLLYILLLLVVIKALLKYKENRLLFIILSCLLISVLPVISLGIDTHDSESERFIYLSSVFAVLFIVELLFHLNKAVIFLFFFILIGVHIFLLKSSADCYKFSGMITKSSLNCLNIFPSSRIIGIDVPTQYKGALMFRAGLPESLEWFKGVNLDKVTIVSQKEYINKIKYLFCYDKPIHNKSLSGYLKNKKGTSIINYEDVIILRWCQDSLVIENYQDAISK